MSARTVAAAGESGLHSTHPLSHRVRLFPCPISSISTATTAAPRGPRLGRGPRLLVRRWRVRSHPHRRRHPHRGGPPHPSPRARRRRLVIGVLVGRCPQLARRVRAPPRRGRSHDRRSARVLAGDPRRRAPHPPVPARHDARDGLRERVGVPPPHATAAQASRPSRCPINAGRAATSRPSTSCPTSSPSRQP